MMSITTLSQTAYCADKSTNSAGNAGGSSAVVRKIEASIAADREKIIEEGKAINADKRKLKEAEKAADSATSEQVKQDIKARELTIANLKKGIINKKYERNDLVYGKTVIPSREYETRY